MRHTCTAFRSSIGQCLYKFLDMAVVNIGTAQNIFHALKESLAKFGLDFLRLYRSCLILLVS